MATMLLLGRVYYSLNTESPLARARHKNYSSIWGDPFPEENNSGDEIKKPNISAYDDPFTPEIDFETGELNKNKFLEERPVPTRPILRLVPRTGRTIHVTKNSDVARSFALLSVHVSSNRVRHDLNSQRYHERPGLKRKRLKSERWQKRFQKGFKACVKRVRELTKQGW
ncbi:putative ribosomal protein s21 protein [Daldinia childiae]|uniref:putative ribosomal protein s21 protein n=1 Tax=Daldinia childiae TaxID=326645 RepID=UPI001447BEF5|nr:putative ribosomal protein s21 protein [Daldinia childiae]KAF3062250.1 putative ribosomal protein s21 protein [Daldinia childiae]